MKTYDVLDAEGRVVAFEVSSGIGRWGARRITRRIPGAEPKEVDSSRPDGTFCAFEISGVRFVLWEPFGDNSRFWIGPEPVRPTAELESVRAAFTATRWWAFLFSFAA